MPGDSLKLRYVLSTAALFLCLDQIGSQIPRWQTAGGNYIFEILAALIALISCLWRAHCVSGKSRLLWIWVAAGVALWGCGISLSAWEEQLEHVPFEIASISDFAFFFSGIPILFALSTPLDGQRSPFFSWLDGIQAGFAGYLAYATIFSVLPFSSQAAQPVSTNLLVLTYNIENAILAGSCLLRLLACPKSGEEYRFFRTISIFLITYFLGIGSYNYLAVITDGKTTANVLADIPFILLAALIMLLSPAAVETERNAIQRNRLALFIDHASPILFTGGLLTLGMLVLSQHHVLGIVAIAVALAVYGLRTTILQIRYVQTQQQLQAARDRLEELSLQDGLTLIANRRRFDQALQSEWRRALRTSHPLSLLLIDLDYFKHLNDTYGHPRGDRCLVQVATAIKNVVARSGDLAARYGGEEFAVILPATTLVAARGVAVKMQAAVRALRIQNETQIGKYLTISIGIACFTHTQIGTPECPIETADQALYKAKDAGRNRIEVGVMAMRDTIPVANRESIAE
jgi:diguanylate cyclase (GGDEF)-like protein